MDAGERLNHRSISTELYKVGVIKTFLHRAHKVSSDWAKVEREVEQITQLLANNN